LIRALSFEDDHRRAVLADLGATLFFVDVEVGGDGAETCEMWTSDGTTVGTARVGAIGHSPEPTGYPEHACPTELVAFAGRVWFPACDAARGCELWASDGTAAGTGRFADLQPGLLSGLPANLKVVGNRLYFSACSVQRGCEPWLTDGTVGGTHRLADIAAGAGASDPRDFTRAGRRVYFAADDGTGAELWAMPVEVFYDGFEGGATARWSEVRP
jgi:ELWxxDGT repeat protein